MGVVGKQRAGKGCRLQVDNVDLRATNMDWNSRTDDLDTSNYECEGFEQGTVGIFGNDLNVEAYWDASTNPIDVNTAPGIYPRDNLPNVLAYQSVNDDTFWQAELARVLSCSTSHPVRGLVGFKASMKSNGGAENPTGSV
jgi:hypothetical protein